MTEKKLMLLSTLRDLAGIKEITVPIEDGQTLREVVEVIGTINTTLGQKIIGKDGELTGLVHILVNGRNIMWLHGLDTILTENDDIILLPPSAGG
jgi:molybdopterin synthase sulfur carrier subunit